MKRRTHRGCGLVLLSIASVFGPTSDAGTTSLAGRPLLASQEGSNATPPVTGQVTFLYYSNIDEAADFYGKRLGLRQTLDRDWVKMYAIASSSFVGLVNATGGTHRPSADKPVMLSVIVEDVDVWYKYLKARGVDIPQPPRDSQRSGVRAFSFKDPEGYTLEVFAWLKR